MSDRNGTAPKPTQMTLLKRIACLALWRMSGGKAKEIVVVTMAELTELSRQIGANTNEGAVRSAVNAMLVSSWVERSKPSIGTLEHLKVTEATRSQAILAAKELNTDLLPKKVPELALPVHVPRESDDTAVELTPPHIEAMRQNDAVMDALLDIVTQASDAPKLRLRAEAAEREALKLTLQIDEMRAAGPEVDPVLVGDIRNVGRVLTKLLDLAGSGSFEGVMLGKLMDDKLGFDMAHLYDLRANLWTRFPEAVDAQG